MALKAEGIWPCTVLSGSYGEDPDPKRAGITRVEINAVIDAGPSKGMFCTYRDDVNARSALYIGRSCKAVGWKGETNGGDLETLAADIDAWIKETGGKALVEIRHIAITKGKRAGETWDKVNSIRRASAPLKKAAPEAHADAREAMREALALDAERSDSAPSPNSHGAPPIGDEDIPF